MENKADGSLCSGSIRSGLNSAMMGGDEMSAIAYYEEVIKLMDEIWESQFGIIKEAAGIFADKVRADKLIHVMGSGHSHMIAEELFVRAGGLANVNAWLDLT